MLPGIPLLFLLLMLPHRGAIKRIGEAMKQQGRQSKTMLTVAEMSKDRDQRQSLVTHTRELAYLVSKFEDFIPGCWWMSVFLLVIRLLQTSLMVLFPEQHIQAAFCSSISLVGICVEHELRPYRRSSDNRTAVCARWLVFIWSFGLLLRLVHVLGSFPSVLVGLVLVFATLAVGGDSLRVAIKETRRELKMRRKREGGQQPTVEEPASLEAEQHSMLDMKQAGPEDGGADVHVPRSSPQEAKIEDVAIEESTEGPSSFSLALQLFDGTLCAGDHAAPGDKPLRPGKSHDFLDRSNAVRQDAHPDLAAKVEELTAQVTTKDKELSMKDGELMVKDREIARLENLLGGKPGSPD